MNWHHWPQKLSSLRQRHQFSVWTTVLLTAIAAVINVTSAIAPPLPERTRWIAPIIPLDLQAAAHFVSALCGFFLLAFLTALLRRQRWAWSMSLVLLGVSVLAHGVKGVDYEESLLVLLVALQLWFTRQHFTAQGDRLSWRQGFRAMLGALGFMGLYSTLGFFLLRQEFQAPFNLPTALRQTLSLFTQPNGSTVAPQTPFAQYFVASLYWMGGTALFYAGYRLLHPLVMEPQGIRFTERQRVADLMTTADDATLAHRQQLPGKAYYFSPSGKSVIVYITQAPGALVCDCLAAIALGDPIGPAPDRSEAILGFQTFCTAQNWVPAFYQVQSHTLNDYRQLGLEVLPIGQAASLTFKNFSLPHASSSELQRNAEQHLNQGAGVRFCSPPLSTDILHTLMQINAEWLKHMQLTAQPLSVGWLDAHTLQQSAVAAVKTSTGDISAFAQLIDLQGLPPRTVPSEITLGLIRRRPHIAPGTLDFLFTGIAEHYRQMGTAQIHLGLAALGGIGDLPSLNHPGKTLPRLYNHLNWMYGAQGLSAAIHKLQPQWEERYLVYPHATALPTLVNALMRADRGDRLWDAFIPGT